MSTHPVGALADAERVNQALAEVGLRRGREPLRLDRAWPSSQGGLIALYTPVLEPANPAGKSRPLFGADGVAPPRQMPDLPSSELLVSPQKDLGLSRQDPRARALADRDLSRAWFLVSDPAAELPKAFRHGLRRGSLHYLSALDCIAGRFPEDPKLRRLPCLLAGESPGLTGLGLDPGPLRVVSYKPTRRCVLASDDGSLYLKAYRRHELERVEATYQTLSRAMPPPSVAYPCARLSRSRALAWRPSRGRSLTRLLGGPEGPQAAAAVGRALAGLHTSGVLLPRRHEVTQELETLEPWVRVVGEAYPGSQALVGEAFETLTSCAPSRSAMLYPAHRDFHDRQVLVEGSRAVLIDLDTAAMAEPELDAANLLAHLDFYELANAGCPMTECSAHFLEAYRSIRRLSESALAWYRSSALLRLACVHSFRHRDRRLAWRLTDMAFESLGSPHRKEALL